MTQRKINGLIAFTSIFALVLFWIVLLMVYEPLYYATGILIPMNQVENVTFSMIGMILFMFLLFWSIRYGLFTDGIRRSLIKWKITTNLRKQLINARFTEDERLNENNERILRLPKIKIMFDDNDLTFNINIRSTIEFDRRLEGVNISSALGSHIVERQYKSTDSNWHIFECFDSSTFTQKVFDYPVDYLEWSKETTDDYSIRIDERTTIPLFHYLISGLTGSGKSLFLSSYIYQLMHKEIKHQFWIIDPKKDDIFNLSLLAFGKKRTGDTSNAVQVIESFHQAMKERQQEMNELKKNKGNSDAQYFKLPALILIIDEFGALRAKWDAELKPADRKHIDSMLADIVFMGRSLGCYCHILTQQANAKTVPTQLRDNLPFKCVLWSSSNETYNVVFSQSAKIPDIDFKQGQGVFSYPGIAMEHEPKLFSSPYCRFLKDINPEVLWKAAV